MPRLPSCTRRSRQTNGLGFGFRRRRREHVSAIWAGLRHLGHRDEGFSDGLLLGGKGLAKAIYKCSYKLTNSLRGALVPLSMVIGGE